jgi:hypothetical protein
MGEGRMREKTVSLTGFVMLLLGTLLLMSSIQPVKASGTIYIGADGNMDPPTAPISTLDNITYTFTDNIYVDANESIRVGRSNIIIDGNGYLLQNPRYAHALGFLLYGPSHGTSNVTIKNTNIEGFYVGVCIDKSLNNSISRARFLTATQLIKRFS